jgi:hypothetical protein
MRLSVAGQVPRRNLAVSIDLKSNIQVVGWFS